MDLKNKNVLVLGLGISGVSTAKALIKLGAKVIVSDSKSEEQLVKYTKELKNLNIVFKLGSNEIFLEDIDLIIKSPGIPLDLPIIKNAESRDIEVITDIELADRICNNKIIAITGTNGKTTTTTLIGEIIKKSGKIVHVTGNIGVGILWEVVNSDPDDIFVVESSSFQLESTKFFKPDISLLINITPDHLKWHKTYQNYIAAKKKIFTNQDENNVTVLNYDDLIVREMNNEIRSNVLYFSQEYNLERGIYLEGEYIIINNGKKAEKLMKYNEIKIPGKHNLENSLAAISVAWSLGIDSKTIVNTLKSFEGVEHRLEFVDIINGISFYNDSKGTNPDASIKAVEALEEPLVLIAGGYDKGSDFNDFIKAFKNKTYSLILLGETSHLIKETAENLDFNSIYVANNMNEAVLKAFEVSDNGYNVLLSPACASWDMYSNFEERGKDFKKEVYKLRGL